ncbi:MFS transporter, partial [Akkermansiaceae bacterium]|nr:MFS transporter [Akkermansiaceae bacterium]
FLMICAAAYLLSLGIEDPLTLSMQHVLGGLIVLPFIVFAPLAGWIGDRFAKSAVIKFASFFQLTVFFLLLAAVMMESLALCVMCFFLLAVQSAILSPAKMGIVKELVGKKKLGFASGVMEMLTILGILGGTILMSRWYSHLQQEGASPWDALRAPVYVLIALTPLAIVLALTIEKTHPKEKRKFEVGILFEHFGQLKKVFKRRHLRLSCIAISYFWTFAGFMQLLSIQVANEASDAASTGIGEDLANMMLMAGGGIAFGSVIGSLICKNRIELGLVPIGGVIMVVMSFMMALMPALGAWFMFAMFMAGVGCALFLVPVNAYIQDESEESERGSVLAVSNLVNCFGGILAVLLQFIFMSMLDLSVAVQFMILGVVTIIATVYSARILPKDTLRLIILSMIRLLYKIRIKDQINVPATGGVLLVPNHLTYVDAFIMSAACQRQVRFLIFDQLYNDKRFGWFLRLFNAVPISSSRSKDAIRVAVERLEAGDVVCIFPEGQLSRTGGLNEIRRGFEMIARKANAPVVPVYMDGLWGSIFSFERGKFLYKMPYRIQYGVNVVFGNVLEPKEATSVAVRSELQRLCYEGINMRSVFEAPEGLAHKKVQCLTDNSQLIEKAKQEYAEMPQAGQRECIYNAIQLLEGPALTRRGTIAFNVDTINDNEATVVMLFLLPVLGSFSVALFSNSSKQEEIRQLQEKHKPDVWIATNEFFQTNIQIPLNGSKYSINGELSDEVYPWYVSNGKVISMQMQNPDVVNATAEFQAGMMAESQGRLLTGYQLAGDSICIGEKEVAKLPEGYLVNKTGFFVKE